MRYGIVLCPRQELNLCSPGFNRKLYRLSYKGNDVRAHQDKGGRQTRTQFWRRDSNPRPLAYETSALPSELHQDTRSK